MNADKNVEKSEGVNLLRVVPMPDEGPNVIPVIGEVTIGRANDNGLVILDLQVSKHHSKIVIEDGKCKVIDLDSRNGTLVNGIKIGSDKPVPLEEGDVVGIGLCELTLSAGTPPPSPEKQRRSIIRSVPRRNELDEFINRMTEDIGLIFEELTDAKPTRNSLNRLCLAHLDNPLETVRRQNRFIARLTVSDTGQIKPWEVPTGFVDAAIALIARLEDLGRPGAVRIEDIKTENYEVVRNAEYLVHGDILPGRLSQLEEVSSNDLREMLAVRKSDAGLIELLRAARSEGIARLAASNASDTAFAVAEILKKKYSQSGGKERFLGKIRTLGLLAHNGESNRHHAATLQLMLQEAGVRSRYVRGMLMGGGHHAWVEVASSGGDEFDLLIDPRLDIAGLIDETRRLGEWGGLTVETFTLREFRGAPERRETAYAREEGVFNEVWRPRMRHSMVERR